jgi:hypothetical protein
VSFDPDVDRLPEKLACVGVNRLPVGDLADGQLHGVADDFVRNSHGCGPSTEDESSTVPMFGRFG